MNKGHFMPPKFKLFGFNICPFAMRIRLLLTHLDLDHRYVEVDVYEEKPDSLLRYSKSGQVPTLVVDTEGMSDSTVIAMWLADVYREHHLLPSNAWQKAKQLEAMALIDQAHTAIGQVMGATDTASFETAVSELQGKLFFLHGMLKEEVSKISTLLDVWKLVLTYLIRQLDKACDKKLSAAIPEIRNYPLSIQSASPAGRELDAIAPKDYVQLLQTLIAKRQSILAPAPALEAV